MVYVEGGVHKMCSVEPHEIGLSRASANELIVPYSTSAEGIFLRILSCEAPTALTSLVAMSAGAILHQAGAAVTLGDGYAMGVELLHSGAAAAKLSRLRRP